jgi:hypothetical protein
MFSDLQFTFPAMLDSASSNAASALGSAAAGLTDAATRLSAAPALSVVNNPVAGGCAGSGDVLTDLRYMLATKVSVVVVHPWSQGIGQGNNYHRYLSGENAVIAAGNKFGDMADTNKPGAAVDAVALLLTGTGFADFAQTLKQFNTVFPIEQTLMCERRARQISTADGDKQILPDAALNAPWQNRRMAGQGNNRNATARVSDLVAHSGGYESGAESVDSELQALINKKKASLILAQQQVDAVAALFSGGVGRGAAFQNQTPAQIKNALLNSGVGHSAPLACCVVLSSAVGGLQLVMETLNL